MTVDPSEPSPQNPDDAVKPSSPARRTRIVLAVDGSPSAERAIAWGIEEAARCGAELHIVSVWEEPDVGPESYEYAPAESQVETAAATQARRRVDDAAELSRRTLPADRVHTAVLSGGPAEMLIERSKEADLLVVGSRGRGGFRGLLLGSVSQQCVSHAHCPVVVVRETEQTTST